MVPMYLLARIGMVPMYLLTRFQWQCQRNWYHQHGSCVFVKHPYLKYSRSYWQKMVNAYHKVYIKNISKLSLILCLINRIDFLTTWYEQELCVWVYFGQGRNLLKKSWLYKITKILFSWLYSVMTKAEKLQLVNWLGNKRNVYCDTCLLKWITRTTNVHHHNWLHSLQQIPRRCYV